MGALRYNFDLIFANLLFGANFSFYVSLTRNYLDFQQIFMLQVLAASIFFIPFALFSKQSYRIPLRDFGNILIVTVLIVYGWMFMLLWGASYTSPIDASTISTLGPVFTILTGHFLLREKNITWARRIGVVLGFAGAAFLLFDKGFRLAPGSSGLGNALVLVAVVMLRIGRGHTVYFDNRAVDKGGQSVEAPYKITVYVNGEQISKLYEKERCLTTVIGDKLELTVEVMQQKGGSETTETYQMTLPHNIDGIIINLPAYMAGLPEEAYLEEFIPAPPTEDDDEEAPGIEDDMGLGDF